MHILGRSIPSKENHKCKNLVIGTFVYSLRTSKEASVFEEECLKGKKIWAMLHRAFKVTINPLLWERWETIGGRGVNHRSHVT